MKFFIKKTHVATNLAAFAVTGISGIIINILIIRLYDAQMLGLFHQIVALYFILSQVSSFGVHLSVLAQLADSDSKERFFLSGLILILAISLLASIVFYFCLKQAFLILDFANLIDSLWYLLLSVALFSLNKFMINVLNAQDRLHLFALASSIRFVMVVIGVLITYYLSLHSIGFSLFFAELVLFFYLVATHSGYFRLVHIGKDIVANMKKHFAFGKHAILSGLIIEVNTKVDIIILSLYVDQSMIGIYSFASTLGEGFYMFINVFKNLNAANLSKQISNKKIESEAKKDILKYIIGLIFFLGITSILIYKPFALIASGDSIIVEKGFYVYACYALCLMVCAKYILLDNILILAKMPKLDKRVRIGSFMANLIVCSIAVPFLNIYGAIGGFISGVVVNCILIRQFAKKNGLLR